MTLSDLSSLGAFVSALAVSGSLIYLGLQTHQASKHTRALISQGSITRNTEIILKMAESEMAAAIISRYGVEPTVELVRQLQARFLIVSQIANADESFEQYTSGLISNHQFASFKGNMVGVFGLPGFRDAWERWKIEHSDSNPKFIQFMDEIAVKASPISFETLSGSDRGTLVA